MIKYAKPWFLSGELPIRFVQRAWRLFYPRLLSLRAASIEGLEKDIDAIVVGAPLDEGRTTRYYRRSKKTAVVLTWRTRNDPCENVWTEIQLRLELMPEITAKETISWLMKKYPDQCNVGQIRTLRRRFNAWRLEQRSQQASKRELMLLEPPTLPPLVTITARKVVELNIRDGDATPA